MLSLFAFIVLAITFGISLQLGILWTGDIGETEMGFLRRILFGSKKASILTSNTILIGGFLAVLIFDSQTNHLEVIISIVLLELAFLLIGSHVFLNWHIGSYCVAGRNKMQIRLLRAQTDPALKQIVARHTMLSVINEIRQGNRASAQVLRDAITCGDSESELLLRQGLEIDEDLVRSILDES